MKIFKNKLAVTIIVLSVAFFGIIIYTIKSDQKGAISGGAGTVVSPLQKIVYGANSKLKGFADFLLNFSEVKAENKSLTNSNIELENKLLEYNNLKEENERLREVFKLTESKDNYTYLGCNIIGDSGGNFLDGYTIDKGEKNGITKDMIVISAKGLVGQVISTGSNWSIVETLTSPNISVAIMVDSTRDSTGILKGYKDKKNNNIVKVENILLDSKIKEGDVIMTSGLGMIYPKEIRIGEVMSVETDNVKVMKSAIIKPYVDFNKLEELFVVIPSETRDIKYD
ncbi:rod shape-determining protein MreC [Clostridium gasigenes]|uniref:rod shape-determining protein MreC n=1 Tax=Clostridium gasigenes TaxID=94869 RepID=UPI001C0BE527|nr:rod shape-determining protein MreC [Clostridium gasigenes]MBU3132859.1 rod shape-determining protein MreC [Clostridium gasigenes]